MVVDVEAVGGYGEQILLMKGCERSSLPCAFQVRVERVREILEKYLEDDDDMMDMYLSRKAVIDERVHEILDHARPVSGANGEAGVSGRDADAGRGADAHAGGEAAGARHAIGGVLNWSGGRDGGSAGRLPLPQQTPGRARDPRGLRQKARALSTLTRRGCRLLWRLPARGAGALLRARSRRASWTRWRCSWRPTSCRCAAPAKGLAGK